MNRDRWGNHLETTTPHLADRRMHSRRDVWHTYANLYKYDWQFPGIWLTQRDACQFERKAINLVCEIIIFEKCSDLNINKLQAFAEGA